MQRARSADATPQTPPCTSASIQVQPARHGGGGVTVRWAQRTSRENSRWIGISPSGDGLREKRSRQLGVSGGASRSFAYTGDRDRARTGDGQADDGAELAGEYADADAIFCRSVDDDAGEDDAESESGVGDGDRDVMVCVYVCVCAWAWAWAWATVTARWGAAG